MKSKLTREEKVFLYMLRTVHQFVEMGLMPIDAIKPEYRVTFNHKNTDKILKKFCGMLSS